MKTLIRWLRALVDEVRRDGMWIYAPALVLPGFSPIWRAAPPPRITEVAANDPAAAPVERTDPRIVAARRATFRLILNPSKA